MRRWPQASLPSSTGNFSTHTAELEAYRAAVDATSWEEIEDQSGLLRSSLERAAKIYMESERVICTWAMGITQHRHSVITIREITNFMLLRGNIGRPGAGLCPVRGHSNVQGIVPSALMNGLRSHFSMLWKGIRL